MKGKTAFIKMGPQRKVLTKKKGPIKATLGARGFEEAAYFRMDSPTCCKGLRLTCCVIS